MQGVGVEVEKVKKVLTMESGQLRHVLLKGHWSLELAKTGLISDFSNTHFPLCDSKRMHLFLVCYLHFYK